MSGLVVGVDAGGTATRAMVVDAGGTVLGTGSAGGGNPNSHPPGQAADAVAEAIAEALSGLDGAATRACVIAMAGTSKLTDPDVAARFARAWDDVGLRVTPRVVPDTEAAFAAATPEPDGTVLIAGTGSIAGRIRTRRMVSTAGGYGWLLGDEGSGFWIGREAVRATLDALTGTSALGPLARAVLAEALDGREASPGEPGARRRAWQRLVTAANADAPVRLSRFAPLVSAHYPDDPAASTIAAAAAGWLTRLALATRESDERTPVVLVGSVLGGRSPVGELVRGALAGIRVLESPDGVLGAAWLAAVDAFGENAPRPAVGAAQVP